MVEISKEHVTPLVKEYDTSNLKDGSLISLVLNQAKFHRGHGQLELSELPLKRGLKLTKKLDKLCKVPDNIHNLSICSDLSASIVRVDGRLLLSIGKLAIKSKIGNV